MGATITQVPVPKRAYIRRNQKESRGSEESQSENKDEKAGTENEDRVRE